jgi:hypothetical protein
VERFPAGLRYRYLLCFMSRSNADATSSKAATLTYS